MRSSLGATAGWNWSGTSPSRCRPSSSPRWPAFRSRIATASATGRGGSTSSSSAAALSIPAHGDDANSAILEARGWIHPLLEERRRAPHDDLLGALVAAEYEGGRLSEAELLSTAITLFLGGHETTTGLIALGMNALVRHPDQLAILRGRPDLVDGAVEEMLRYDAPFQMNLRMLTEDVEMDGVTMREGDLVRQALGSANRDPERFEDPDRVLG